MFIDVMCLDMYIPESRASTLLLGRAHLNERLVLSCCWSLDSLGSAAVPRYHSKKLFEISILILLFRNSSRVLPFELFGFILTTQKKNLFLFVPVHEI